MARAETLRPLYTIETERIREQAWVDLYTAASPFVNEGAYEEAIPYFEDANSIYRGRPEVMLMLGQIYANLGRYDEAVANLRTALEMVNGPRFDEMDPSIQAVWTEQRETLPLLIAQTLMNAQRYPEAAAELRALLVDSPGDLILTRNLASLYVEMEMTDSATVLFDQLLARTDLGAGDYYQIGIGLYSMDDFDRAADAFQATVEEAPRDRDAVEMWTRSIHEGHPPRDSVEAPMEVLDELESAADQWLELDPYNRNALLILAQTTNRKGDSESAAAWVSRIEALPVTVDNLQARRDPDGGATVTGSVMNVNQEAGASVIFRFTFYGEGGAAIGTQDATVRLSAPDQSQVFQVVFESSERVLGYTYEILM
jgi:tetratricopeptide (TPR) repeat protein